MSYIKTFLLRSKVATVATEAISCVFTQLFTHTDILTGDPQLADEIEFDLRRFEEDHIAAAAVPAETPHAQLVSRSLIIHSSIIIMFVIHVGKGD